MTAGRALFWGLLLALLACGTSGRASSAVKGLEGQEGPHRALLENSSTAGVPPPPFQVVITCDQPGPTTSSPLPLWTVDFGRPLQQANPLSLFRVAGVYRVDVVYQPGQGLLYVLGFVATRDQPTTLQLTVPAGVATAAADGAPNAEAVTTLAYQPVQSASGLSWLGAASSAAFGGTMALSFATGLMGGAGGVGMGALGFAGYAQTFYYSGSLPLSNMPENYKTVSGSFGWTTLSTLPSVGAAEPAPPPGQMSQAEDTLYSKQRFPFPPIVVIPQQQPDDNASAGGGGGTGGGDGGGDAGSGGGAVGSPPGVQPGDVVVWPIGSLEDQMGSPGDGADAGSVFDGPLPPDSSVDEPAPAAPPPAASAGSPSTPPAGSVPAASIPGTPPGQQGQQGQPPSPPAKNNPFDPNQVDDPAFQNPPPEPDLPPSQQGGPVPSPPQAGGTPGGSPATGQPGSPPGQGSPPGAGTQPGSPPGSTPLPGSPPGSTPLPGSPPGSNPLPGSPPGTTPGTSPPGTTPVPGAPPAETPVPGAPPGEGTPVPGYPPGQGSTPGAPPGSDSPPGQTPVPGSPPARSPPGNRTLPPSALLPPPAGGPSIIPSTPPPSGDVGGQGDGEGPPVSDPPGPPGADKPMPPLPPGRTLPRAKRPPPPGGSSNPEGAAPPVPPTSSSTPPGAPPLPGTPAPPGVVIKAPAPPGTVGTQTGGEGPVFDDPNYDPNYQFPPFPPNPPPRPPRPPPRPPRPPPRPPRSPPSPPSPPLPPPSPPVEDEHVPAPAPAPGPGDPWDFEAPAPAPEEQAQPEQAPPLAPPAQAGQPSAAPPPKPGNPALPLPDAPAPGPMIDGAPGLAPEPSAEVVQTPPPPSPSPPPPEPEPSPALPPPSPSPPPPSPSPPAPEPVAASPPPSPSPPPPFPSPPPPSPFLSPPAEPSPPPPELSPPPLEPSPPPPELSPPPLEPSPPPPELSPPPLEPSPPPPELSPPPLEPSPPPPELSPPPLEPSPPPPELSPPPPEPSPPPPSPVPSPSPPPPEPEPSPSPPPPKRSPSPPPKEEPATEGPAPGGPGGQGFVRRRLTAAEARRLIEDPLSSLTSSGFYVVTTVTVSDVANGTTTGQPENVSDASVGASALSRIRAIQSAAGSESAADQNMQILWNVLFWSAVVIGGFAVLHLGFVLLLRWRGKSTPKMLHMPRLELLLFMMVLPMVVAASATLLRGPGAVHVAVGVIFAVLLPLAFLGTALGFVVHYLVRNSVEKRRAVFVLQLPPGVGGAGGDAAPAPGGAGAGALAAAAASPRRAQAQRHEQQQGGPELLGRNSLTEQFLTSQEGSFRAGAGSGATFVSASSLPDAAGPGPARIPSGQFMMDRQGSVAERAEGRAEPGGGAPPPAAQRGPLRRGALALQRWLFRPLFGFELVGGGGGAAAAQQPSVASIPVGTAADGGVVVGQGAWLCKSKWDTTFVKRYGSLFEDARGPQVYHITSVYESDEGAEPHAGTGVLVPASYTWSDTTVQTLQTFGILLSVAKMVLFALIINAVGSVNSIPQVLALVLVALLHLVYLRLCLPFRMRIELAAEMVASCCDLGVFVCGIILITKTSWTAAERRSMGLAMLVMQATGFLIFISVRVLLAGRTILLTVAPMLRGLVRRGHSAPSSS